jgi:hypothetical protein
MKTNHRHSRNPGSHHFFPLGACVLAIAISIFSGCAALPFLDFPQKKAAAFKPDIQIPYQDFSGIIHVHTSYSQNSTGSFEEVARAAQKTNLDFVIVTDHNTLGGLRDNKEGFYDKTLILVGSELTSPGGHIAVMDINKEVAMDQAHKAIVKEVQAAGAISFICHPNLERQPWRDWSLVSAMTGMEIYNLPTAAYEDGTVKLGLKTLFFPPRLFFRSFLKRPDDVLARWDEVLRERRFVGIAGVDAHEKYRIFGAPLDSYTSMFKVAQTHVWAHELSKKDVYEAIRSGHVYVGFDLVKPVRNFLFMAETSDEQAIMGDMIKYRDNLKLRVFLPEEAEIHILKDGELWKAANGKALDALPDGPGVYRVEIYLNKKLWILSNPIYVVKW